MSLVLKLTIMTERSILFFIQRFLERETDKIHGREEQGPDENPTGLGRVDRTQVHLDRVVLPVKKHLLLFPLPTVDHGRKGGIKNINKQRLAQGVDNLFEIVTPKLIADEFPNFFGAVIETVLQKFTQRRRQGELLLEFAQN